MAKNANQNKRRNNGSTRGVSGFLDSAKQSNLVTRSGATAIGWASNAPWAATGYGTQTAQVTSRLAKEGHQVAIFSNYGLEGANSTWKSQYGQEIDVFQRGTELYSNDITPAHMAYWITKHKLDSHILFTLYDVWIYKNPAFDKFNIASWVPIDHMPAPPGVSAWCRKPNVTPIAMSKFGQQMLENVGIETLYAPHAVEKVFKPCDSFNGVDGRASIGVDDSTFVVGMNAANKGTSPVRKAFGENLLAFALFAAKHDDVMLYMHTDSLGALGGIKLWELIDSVGIPRNKVVFVDPYEYRIGIEQGHVAALYTAMDVLLATSYGEGFGVPTIEAQACGTPVIVSDFAASSELVGEGWLVEGQLLWDAPQSAFFNIPSVPGIVDALEQAYQRGRGRSQKALDFAADYDADVVFEKYWKPIMQILHEKGLEA